MASARRYVPSAGNYSRACGFCRGAKILEKLAFVDRRQESRVKALLGKSQELFCSIGLTMRRENIPRANRCETSPDRRWKALRASRDREACEGGGRRASIRLAVCLARAPVARLLDGANFKHHAPLGKRFGQGRIVHHGDAVADALGSQEFRRLRARIRGRRFLRRDRRCATLRRAPNRMRAENWPLEKRARRRPCRTQRRPTV